MNAIELAFGKIKVWLSKAAAVTFEALSVAVRDPKRKHPKTDSTGLRAQRSRPCPTLSIGCGESS